MSNKENSKEPENSHRSIKELSEDDRPRERLKKFGVSNLSDSELLAVLIRSGTKGYSAIEVARDMISKHSTLSNIASSDFSEFKRFKGLGETKAITLAAAFEIGKRLQSEPFELKEKVQKPQDIANYYIPILRNEKAEVFRTLLLNSANKIFRNIEISRGILNASLVHPREVFKIAISESAASIILLHNHPSGNPEPSKEDIHITRQLVDSGKVIGISIYDHIIIAGNKYCSFAEMGLL